VTGRQSEFQNLPEAAGNQHLSYWKMKDVEFMKTAPASNAHCD
jgi:hypothetical protein